MVEWEPKPGFLPESLNPSELAGIVYVSSPVAASPGMRSAPFTAIAQHLFQGQCSSNCCLVNFFSLSSDSVRMGNPIGSVSLNVLNQSFALTCLSWLQGRQRIHPCWEVLELRSNWRGSTRFPYGVSLRLGGKTAQNDGLLTEEMPPQNLISNFLWDLLTKKCFKILFLMIILIFCFCDSLIFFIIQDFFLVSVLCYGILSLFYWLTNIQTYLPFTVRHQEDIKGYCL